MPKINWSDAVKKIIPNGTEIEYTVKSAEEKLSKKGQPMINVAVTVTDPDEYAGQLVFNTFSLQPTSLWALKEFLLSCNAPEEVFGDGDIDTDVIIAAVPGLTGSAIVEVNTFKRDANAEEEQNNRIKKWVKPAFSVFAGAK